MFWNVFCFLWRVNVHGCFLVETAELIVWSEHELVTSSRRYFLKGYNHCLDDEFSFSEDPLCWCQQIALHDMTPRRGQIMTKVLSSLTFSVHRHPLAVRHGLGLSSLPYLLYIAVVLVSGLFFLFFPLGVLCFPSLSSC
jgi:hypothetical protein